MSVSQVDPQTLIGERVFITTDKEYFVGTLTECRTFALHLSNWVNVYKFDDEKISAHGPFGHYSKIIMHSGGAREMEEIKLCKLDGDPFIDSEGASDLPLWLTETPKIDQTETPKSLHEIKRQWAEKKKAKEKKGL